MNIGAGYWTPYDKYLKNKSKKIYNVDTSLFVKIFRIFNCKRIILDDKNIYEIIKEYKIDTVTCFHSVSFIHINLPKLIKFCTKKNIRFLFDWSVQNDLMIKNDISKFCYGKSKYEIFKLIKTWGWKAFIQNFDLKLLKSTNKFTANIVKISII